MLFRSLICGAMAAARLAELAYSHRNMSRQLNGSEGESSRRSFPIMVALHSVVIIGTWLFGGRVRPAWLLVLLAAQPARAWVLLSLKRNWNARGRVAENLEVVTDGPYAYVRHPNYVVVAVELAALPLACGLKRLAMLASLINAVLLTIRVRDEERLLFRSPEYEAYFRDKPRFLPYLF